MKSDVYINEMFLRAKSKLTDGPCGGEVTSSARPHLAFVLRRALKENVMGAAPFSYGLFGLHSWPGPLQHGHRIGHAIKCPLSAAKWSSIKKCTEQLRGPY